MNIQEFDDLKPGNHMVSTPSPSLLIVEDEFMIANDLQRILAKAGYQILGIAGSVPEARDLIESQPPDIVLLDIFLDGDETGIDLAHWLREKNTPFVFLSANLTDSVLTAAKETHPFGFLNKPFREKDVLTTLEIARYRHAHSTEARLRRQQSLQMAVNNAIITIQDREKLCLAIAHQIDRLVPFSLFHLQIWQPEGNVRYWLLLEKNGMGRFVPITRTALLLQESQKDEINPFGRVTQDQKGGILTSLAFDQRCNEDPLVRFCRDTYGVRSLAVFPIQLKQQVSTTLTLAHQQDDGFTQKEHELVSLIIPQIALALTNLLAYEEIEDRRQLKATELAIVTAFQNGKRMTEIIPQIAQSLNAMIPFDWFSILLKRVSQPTLAEFGVQKKEGRFEPVFGSNDCGSQLTDSETWPNHIVITREQIGEHDPFVKKVHLGPFEMKSSLLAPIMLQDGAKALLVLGSRVPYAFTQNDGQRLQEISGPLAMALANLQAFEQIKELSEQLEQEKTYLTEEIKINANFEEIIGSSSSLVGVLKKVSQVAPTDSTVLIMGETGTGKELIARAVHNLSSRKKRSMVKVNCAALPPQLIESELFGHEKGAFTGAFEKRIGKFEMASGGTIFLDEIGELPLELQSKLLRVIQEKEIERLGGKGPILIDVRIIAATNRNLLDEVAANRFRPDLYYRLNVFPIQLAPLRERPEDIIPLSMHFLEKIRKKLGKTLTGIANASLQQMQTYSWPGNIRELEHVLERAAILSPTTTLELAEPLQSTLPIPAASKLVSTAVEPLQNTMRTAIQAALLQSGNRIRGQGGAAELLNIKPTTLEARMKKLNIGPTHRTND